MYFVVMFPGSSGPEVAERLVSSFRAVVAGRTNHQETPKTLLRSAHLVMFHLLACVK